MLLADDLVAALPVVRPLAIFAEARARAAAAARVAEVFRHLARARARRGLLDCRRSERLRWIVLREVGWVAGGAAEDRVELREVDRLVVEREVDGLREERHARRCSAATDGDVR